MGTTSTVGLVQIFGFFIGCPERVKLDSSAQLLAGLVKKRPVRVIGWVWALFESDCLARMDGTGVERWIRWVGR